MDSVAVAFPVAQEKRESLEQNLHRISEAIRGSLGRRLHQGHHQEYGIQRVRVFHQKKPQDILIIVVEGEDLERATRERWGRDEVQELNRLIYEATGVHPTVHEESTPNLIHEWRAD
jgi:hypothetical protein